MPYLSIFFRKAKANVMYRIEKSQAPSTKHQTNLKFQAPMTETHFGVPSSR